MIKKLIAPILISIGLIALLIGYILMIFLIPGTLPLKIILGVLYAALIGVVIFVLAERIKEIRSGETDDLSQY